MHTRYYQLAGITVQLDSELPIADSTFATKFKLFETDGPGCDIIRLVHRFGLPEKLQDYGAEVYRKSP